MTRALVLLAAAVVGRATAVLAQGAQPLASVIRVEVVGLRNDKGHVLCALYASADGFPQNSAKAVATAKAEIAGGHAICEFAGTDTGRLAIAVFHDENDNGKLDTKIFSIPREGVGASNNAQGRFGPPKFDDAAFRFAGGHLDVKITIKYF